MIGTLVVSARSVSSIPMLLSVSSGVAPAATMMFSSPSAAVFNCYPREDDLLYWDSSYWIAHSLVPACWFALFTVSLAAIGIAVAEVLEIFIARRQTRRFQSQAAEALYYGRSQEVLRLASLYNKSPLASVVAATFPDPYGPAQMYARNEMIVAKTGNLSRAITWISALQSAIPFLGLLTSMLMVIKTFESAKYAECARISGIAGQMGEDMWPLVLSIIVAVPVRLLYRYLRSALATFQIEMDRLSLSFIERICTGAGRKPVPRERINSEDQRSMAGSGYSSCKRN